MIFLLFFLLFMAIELWVLVEIASQVGSIITVLGVFLTAVFGFQFARMQGFLLLRQLVEARKRKETPRLVVLEGIFVVIAGILLLLPGFITDTIGVLLLIPAVRRRLAAHMYNKSTSAGHRIIDITNAHEEK